MAYAFSCIEHPGFVHCIATGDRDVANMTRFFADIQAACRRLGQVNVLVETRLTGPSLDITAIMRVVTEHSADAVRLRRIAYVDSTPGVPGRAMFAETVALNRGVNIRLLPDLEAAERWLLQK